MPVSAAAPSAQRLDAAINLIVERLAPDQIILFGSGARDEMTASSDLDLLVIQDEDSNRSSSTRHERWRYPDNGDQIDVVVMNRTTAERHRGRFVDKERWTPLLAEQRKDPNARIAFPLCEDARASTTRRSGRPAPERPAPRPL